MTLLRPLSFAVLFTALAFPAVAGGVPPLNRQYAQCTGLVRSAPQEAYKFARAWYGRSQHIAAEHCMAMALFELREYTTAAESFERILIRMTPGQGAMWLGMKAQAAKAHSAAGNDNAALSHLEQALHWTAQRDMDMEMAPLLAQRAEIHERQNRHLQAVQDLDHALAIRPTTATRLQRARLMLKSGHPTEALDDLDTVLKSEPQNREALNLRAQASRR